MTSPKGFQGQGMGSSSEGEQLGHLAPGVAAKQKVEPLTPASALGTAWRSLWRAGPAAYL